MEHLKRLTCIFILEFISERKREKDRNTAIKTDWLRAKLSHHVDTRIGFRVNILYMHCMQSIIIFLMLTYIQYSQRSTIKKGKVRLLLSHEQVTREDSLSFSKELRILQKIKRRWFRKSACQVGKSLSRIGAPHNNTCWFVQVRWLWIEPAAHTRTIRRRRGRWEGCEVLCRTISSFKFANRKEVLSNEKCTTGAAYVRSFHERDERKIVCTTQHNASASVFARISAQGALLLSLSLSLSYLRMNFKNFMILHSISMRNESTVVRTH